MRSFPRTCDNLKKSEDTAINKYLIGAVDHRSCLKCACIRSADAPQIIMERNVPKTAAWNEVTINISIRYTLTRVCAITLNGIVNVRVPGLLQKISDDYALRCIAVTHFQRKTVQREGLQPSRAERTNSKSL